ncbi:MAG: glycosyltransferase family 4 protein [Goleter apudmare HA4340-LM2]|nr:glycosyltransferase family 4 protein [Goleter apudmare HA4340-LM2]
MTNDNLDIWREEGTRMIPKNLEVFNNLILKAEDLVSRKQLDAAAAYLQIAAAHAVVNHCGFYSCPRLEHILLKIGQRFMSKSVYPRKGASSTERVKKILHVSTHVSHIGGISRLLQRWIQQDSERSHSIALTKQGSLQVPSILQDTVLRRNGSIYLLDEGVDKITSIAKRLYECSVDVDIVIIHTWEFDVIPTIAFANKKESPPIIYVNNGDHWFWVGVSISDVVANLRESGMRLSEERRGIESERNMLLPTILEPLPRTLSRSEAKQLLGIDQDCTMLLSIARAAKYRTVGDTSFADAHVQLLKHHKQAVLIVIGPGNSDEDWSKAISQVDGRIRVYGETQDTTIFYQAADIYVDSFPFVSITSLLEAGSFGVPLVSRYPYSSDASATLGADMPGLSGNLIRVRDIDEYTDVLSRLIEDQTFRLSLGQATKSKIEAVHWGENWQNVLNEVYHQAITLPAVLLPLASVDKVFLNEPDVYLPLVNGMEINRVIQSHLPYMPFRHRLFMWLSMVRKYGLRNNPPNTLIAGRFRARFYTLRSRLPHFLKLLRFSKL